MKQPPMLPKKSNSKDGGILGYGLLWLLGIPLPILVLVAMLRGCA